MEWSGIDKEEKFKNKLKVVSFPISKSKTHHSQQQHEEWDRPLPSGWQCELGVKVFATTPAASKGLCLFMELTLCAHEAQRMDTA